MTLLFGMLVIIPALPDGDAPIADAAGEEHVAVALGTVAGAANGCALTDLGEVFCWGAGWDGRVGNGQSALSSERFAFPTPYRVYAGGIAQISGDCALSTGGDVTCWGFAGGIEDGSGSYFSSPPWGAASPASYGFAPSVEIAGRCARQAAGTVQCQGWDNWGQLGVGGASWPGTGYGNPPPSSPVAVSVVGLTDAVSISAFPGGNCAVRETGNVMCWGLNGDGQLGNGDSGTRGYPCPPNPLPCTDSKFAGVPTQVLNIDDAVRVSGTCALRAAGKVSCWGKNRSGRFNPAGGQNDVLPPFELPQFEGALDIATNYSSLCAVLADTTVACQGSNPPVGLDTVLGAREVAPVGFNDWCARYVDGSILCWGSNGAGQLGNGTIADPGSPPSPNPGAVLGFGGEAPVDAITVDLVLDRDEVELEFDAAGDPVPQNITATLTLKNTSDDPVPFVTVDETLATTLIAGQAKEIAQVSGPTGAALEIGTMVKDQVVTRDYVFSVSDTGAYGIKALPRWADPVTLQTETGFAQTAVVVETDDGLEIELVGEKTSVTTFRIIATISNTSGNSISALTFPGGLGISAVAGTTPVTFVNGPIPALPAALGPLETKTVRWSFAIADLGVVEFSLSGNGVSSSGKSVSAVGVVTGTVTGRDIEELDIAREAYAGMQQFLTDASSKGQELIDETVAAARASRSQTDEFYDEQYRAWRSIGFSETTAKLLAAGDVSQEAFSNYTDSFIQGAKDTGNRLAQDTGEQIYKFVDTISDPVKRNKAAREIVDVAIREGGYLGDAFAIPVDQKLDNIYDGLVAAGTETVNSIGLAATGQVDIWRIEANEFVNDLLGYSNKVGERHGGQAATVGWTTALGVVEEVGTGGAGPIVRLGRAGQGVDALRTTARTLDQTEDIADVGMDTFGRAIRKANSAEQVAKAFDDLPYGTTLDLDDLERLAGFEGTDAIKIQQIRDAVQDRYGVDVNMVFRTAEPYSVGLDGVGKRSFTKEKAVGQLDVLLGAPESLKGKVAIFEPKPLSPKAIADAEALNPGFSARYEDRLKTQQKNWDSFQKGTARTQDIVAASKKYDGVTVLNEVPGNPTHGVKYLEQLKDPDYIASRGFSAQEADDLFNELSSHPSATRANLELDMVDGAFTLSDKVVTKLPDGSTVVQKKPVISDYDGQAVLPDDGVWPDGVRAQVEIFVKQEMDKIGRSGRHGWSDAANDLPSDLFHLAAEYVMTTTHPSAAGRVSRDLARRFGVLADEFRGKADRLEAALPGLTDPAAIAKQQAEIARLRDLAGSYDTFTPVAIRALWPPGEKTIVFSKGGASVGSNQGLNP